MAYRETKSERGRRTLVYPDSSDLIRIERDEGSLTEEIGDWLKDHDARLVLSATLIDEVAKPIDEMPAARVTLLMNRLETLPHTWFRSVDLEELELAAALRCFAGGLPWDPVNPFVESYVDTLSGMLPRTSSFYRGRSLAEIVWELLYGVSTTRIRPSLPALAEWLRANRAAIAETDDAAYRRQLRVAFERAVRTVGARLPTFSTVDTNAFVEHLWTHPDWCPGSRLSFDVAQIFQADAMTRGRDSDIEDLVRIKAVPYVNIFVADASKRAYLNAARTAARSRLRDCAYWSQCTVVATLDEAQRLV